MLNLSKKNIAIYFSIFILVLPVSTTSLAFTSKFQNHPIAPENYENDFEINLTVFRTCALFDLEYLGNQTFYNATLCWSITGFLFTLNFLYDNVSFPPFNQTSSTTVNIEPGFRAAGQSCAFIGFGPCKNEVIIKDESGQILAKKSLDFQMFIIALPPNTF